MPNIVIGSSSSYDGTTKTAAQIASTMGSTYASASSGALTLKSGQGVAVSNADSNNPLLTRDGAANMPMEAGGTISSNTENFKFDVEGLFVTQLTVNSGVYLYGNDNVGLSISANNATVINNGYILGGGGAGAGQAGRHAIEIAATGVSITNASGAYIAGGGGGGAVGRNGGGGGGAGGGAGSNSGGAGGGPNASGSNGTDPNSSAQAGGGGAGGGGSASTFYGTAGGGGGGRILPGTGGFGGYGGYATGGAGGSGSNAGGNGVYGGSDSAGSRYSCGGGGGWSASGGLSYAHTGTIRYGGTGGKAIEDNGNSYTFSNSGTVYGGT